MGCWWLDDTSFNDQLVHRSHILNLRTRCCGIFKWCNEIISMVSTGDCYNNNGASYSGTVSSSETGSRCQKWSNTAHTYMTNLFPALKGSNNYCRNPGGVQTRPWCFTENGNLEYCSISQCKGQYTTCLQYIYD